MNVRRLMADITVGHRQDVHRPMDGGMADRQQPEVAMAARRQTEGAIVGHRRVTDDTAGLSRTEIAIAARRRLEVATVGRRQTEGAIVGHRRVTDDTAGLSRTEGAMAGCRRMEVAMVGHRRVTDDMAGLSRMAVTMVGYRQTARLTRCERLQPLALRRNQTTGIVIVRPASDADGRPQTAPVPGLLMDRCAWKRGNHRSWNWFHYEL
jgi:hypothetical protein